MSQISAEAYRQILAGVTSDPRMDAANVTAPASAAKLSVGLLGVGAAGLAVTLVGGFVVNPKHAMASYMVGAGAVLAISLGALILTMCFHLVNAGWCATVRRQFENLASLVPVALGLVVVAYLLDMFVMHGEVWEWMVPGIKESDPLIRAKAGYFGTVFVLVRVVIYFALWGFLSARLRAFSTEQDRTGDRFLSARARFMCAWGLPLTALSVAFAGFDFFMSMQPHFFSTMWGVYVFAGGASACMAVMVLTFCVLRFVGRLHGLVTEEHFHDLGKLLFAFTCFWAYIGFSQYFLIWYSNIPEETFWMLQRTTGAWEKTGILLAVGHFIVPFFLLLGRTIKRTPNLVALVAAWILFMHVIDYVWVIRPILHIEHPGHEFVVPTPATWWVDIAGVVGVFGVFFGAFVWRVASGPLLALKDPKLPEAMAHKNYV